jgi:hypothetical protein
MIFHLDKLMDLAVVKQASGLQFRVGQCPSVTIGGNDRFLNLPVLSVEDTLRLLKEIAPQERLHDLQTSGSCEFAFDFEGRALFRVSARIAAGVCEILLHLDRNEEVSSLRQLPITFLDRRLSHRLDLPLQPYSSSLRLARSVEEFVATFGLHVEIAESDGRKVLSAWYRSHHYKCPMTREEDLPVKFCSFILDILDSRATRSD